MLTALLMGYGYVCRVLNIYFFWESKTLGAFHPAAGCGIAEPDQNWEGEQA